jgi:CheY-like chemotaxis protein
MLVENGRAAIEAVNNAQLSFDLVLMDLQMPVMDGYEATAILKRNGCKVPVVACSASALADVSLRSEVVFDGYLGKPIDKIKLYAVLTEFLEKNR